MKLNQQLLIGIGIGFLLSKFLAKNNQNGTSDENSQIRGPYRNLLAGYRYGNTCSNCSNRIPVRYGFTEDSATGQYAKLTA